MSSDEFSCPNCRSSLYDPISGCLVCSEKGSRALNVGVENIPTSLSVKRKKLSKAEREKKLDDAERKLERQELLDKAKRVAEHNKLLEDARDKEKRERLRAKSKEIFAEEGIEGLFKGGKLSACCPFCGSVVKVGNIYRHFNNNDSHQYFLPSHDKALLDDKRSQQVTAIKSEQKSSQAKQKSSAETKKQPSRKESKKQPSSKTVYYPADQHEHMKESFRQSLYDERDASSSYGHRFRENGRFSSHPLHDDYDDESFPD